jgi:uncharacterized protein (TIGR02271 family)
MPEMTEAYEWKGRDLIDQNEEKIGKIDEIYLDDVSGRPEWVTVHTGLLGTKTYFVPLAGASAHGEDVHVPLAKAQVTDAPSIDADGDLSEADEVRLFEHYNVPYNPDGSVSATGVPEAGQPHEHGTDRAMTRSEEELSVGTRSVERGRVRLRKYVVTEMVTKTVPVQREEVRVEREPITDANRDAAMAGPEITESEHEVILHEDEPVVEKTVVPKERVRLETDTVSDEREVSEEVRKEQIETDADDR